MQHPNCEFGCGAPLESTPTTRTEKVAPSSTAYSYPPSPHSRRLSTRDMPRQTIVLARRPHLTARFERTPCKSVGVCMQQLAPEMRKAPHTFQADSTYAFHASYSF